MIKTLREKVNPAHTALVVVDVQNDFCSPGGYMNREGHALDMVQEMLPRLEKLLTEAKAAGIPRIYFQANYATLFNWYLSPVWLDRARRANPQGGHLDYAVCEEGAWGFELVDRIRPTGEEGEIILKKHRYSGFVNTELDLILRSGEIKTVIITGVATNVCVESTARDAFMRDYFVIMPSDCCATYSDAEQEATLNNIRQYFGEVVLTEELIESWRVSEGVRRASQVSLADAG